MANDPIERWPPTHTRPDGFHLDIPVDERVKLPYSREVQPVPPPDEDVGSDDEPPPYEEPKLVITSKGSCCENPQPRILEKNHRQFCMNCRKYLDKPRTP